MNRFKQFIFVFWGGAFGSLCRHLISQLNVSFPLSSFTLFPTDTFIVNVVGSFIIGILGGFSYLNKKISLFFSVGFCGGFTTFSTFSKEFFSLMADKNYIIAITYMLLSLLLGTLLGGAGYLMGQRIKTSIH